MNSQRQVTTTIDAERCIGCGACVRVCPKETLSMQDEKAVVSGDTSLNCGHCAAACPTGAITVAALAPQLNHFRTFTTDEGWLAYGDSDTGKLVRLMRSRRSCRNFSQKPVSRDHLEDLIRIGITAPSGSNCQLWTFTVLPSRAAVLALAERIAAFFQRLNALAQKAWLRCLLKLCGKPSLADYHRDHFQTVARALNQWQETGCDRLFHGAPAALVVGCKKRASCPAEDALLATGQILLAAHSMGLGTCLIGFAIEAMRHDPTIVRALSIPDDERPYAVIAIGWPTESYQTVCGRKPIEVRYAEG
jgi:nitroreductase/NAD-dependent dihydropyrimidine dehydrogenase PreA subunit